MSFLTHELPYALVLIRNAAAGVVVVWAVITLARARTQGIRVALGPSLAEATMALGLVAIWALTVAPLVRFTPGDEPAPMPMTLVPVIPVVAGVLSPDGPWMVVNLVANVALYVPLGAGLAWRFRPRVRVVAATGALVSAAAEAWQFVSAQQRTSDINDVLLNTLGAVLGAWIAVRVLRVRAHRSAVPRAG